MIVVLGMHAGGTSLVSRLLMSMGVNMGKEFMGPVKGVPTWEDVDFVKTNAAILSFAGGDWKNVPSNAKITKAVETLYPRMEMDIERKIQSCGFGLWGFKDPRTALTVEHWHNMLPNPSYVIVRRNHGDTAKSILNRGPSKKEDYHYWVGIASKYNARIDTFLKKFNPPKVEVKFEKLLRSNTAIEEVRKIAALVMATAIPLALKEIKFR